MMTNLKKLCRDHSVNPAMWTVYGMGMGTAIGVAIHNMSRGIAIGLLGNLILQLFILWVRKRKP